MLLAIDGPELDEFISTLSEEILKIEPSCMLNPDILNRYQAGKQKMIGETNVVYTAEYDSEVEVNYARQTVATVDGKTFLNIPLLHQEVFGPFSMVVKCENEKQLEQVISSLEGQLTGTLISENQEIEDYDRIVEAMKNKVGRLIFNGVPTGVEVCPAMQHGGPYPASTDSRFGAVGIHAIQRWVRPVSYQNWPDNLLPNELKDKNPLGIERLVNGKSTSKTI